MSENIFSIKMNKTLDRRFIWRLGLLVFAMALSLMLLGEAALAQSLKPSLSTPPPGLENLVARVMKTFEVPGLSLVIVKNGQVSLAKGYGVKKLGEPAPVNAQTLFGIASNSKLFTAIALGMLVDEGKIRWDDPVVNHMPDFQMYDPVVSREIMVKDLLCHRSGLGLGAGDLMLWPASDLNRKEILRRLRYIRPSSSFRTRYAYSNIMFVVAGELLERVSGLRWEDYVREKIQKRVGMNYSNTSCALVAQEENKAWPHVPLEGQVVPVKNLYLTENVNPAGGINSCAEDMAKWMLVLLDKGKLPDGSRLVSERTFDEITSIVTPVPISRPAPELSPLAMNFNGYGLGIRIRDYRRHKVLTHTGGLEGYVSQVWLMPEIGLGITILTNQESTNAFYALNNQIVDYYLKVPDFDWVEAYKKVSDRNLRRSKERLDKIYASRKKNTQPSLPLGDYAGLYRDDWYGEIEVRYENGQLTMQFKHSPELYGRLEHWHYDTFVARWFERELRAEAFVTFHLDHKGAVSKIKMMPFSPDVDFSYDFQDLLLKPVKENLN
ncbi:MAG: serine hydrolase [Acidobacteriota bacterium]|nr:serine hydrolase [Acidobacteriota bacterium]MDY0231392.1 serine hydrolase [Candidatus Saccharicenans sp.]